MSLTEAGNKFDGLVTLKAGKTNLYASENLNVLLNQTGDTTLGTDKALRWVARRPTSSPTRRC